MNGLSATKSIPQSILEFYKEAIDTKYFALDFFMR